jgi:hypothetical protein
MEPDKCDATFRQIALTDSDLAEFHLFEIAFGLGRRASRQISFAAKPQPLLRFHSRHPEQVGEQIEFVASRQPGQLGEVLRDERRGLIGAAIP